MLLTRIAFPYLALHLAGDAASRGVLNALGRFAAAAFAPVAPQHRADRRAPLHLLDGRDRRRVAAGIAARRRRSSSAASLQLVVLVMSPAAAPALVLRLRRPRLTPGVQAPDKLAVPSVIAGGITQINIVVGTIIASLQRRARSPGSTMPTGSTSCRSASSASPSAWCCCPTCRAQLRAGRDDVADHTQNRAARIRHGADAAGGGGACSSSRRRSSRCCSSAAPSPPPIRPRPRRRSPPIAVGLPAFVLIRVSQPGFFAREDTRTPMWFAGISVVVNVVAVARAVPVLRPCRHRRRDVDRRLGQHRAARRRRCTGAAISRRRGAPKRGCRSSSSPRC